MNVVLLLLFSLAISLVASPAHAQRNAAKTSSAKAYYGAGNKKNSAKLNRCKIARDGTPKLHKEAMSSRRRKTVS